MTALQPEIWVLPYSALTSLKQSDLPQNVAGKAKVCSQPLPLKI